MEFEAGDADEIIWCKAACGNNVHKSCFQQWAKSKPGEVRCVYCRTPWMGETKDIKSIARSGGAHVNAEGYVNVAAELGISGERDTSTYHYHRNWGGSWSGRRGRRRNWIEYDYDYEGEEDEEDDDFDEGENRFGILG